MTTQAAMKIFQIGSMKKTLPLTVLIARKKSVGLRQLHIQSNVIEIQPSARYAAKLLSRPRRRNIYKDGETHYN